MNGIHIISEWIVKSSFMLFKSGNQLESTTYIELILT